MSSLYAIIRVRGTVDVPPDVEHALKLLRLHKKYHMSIYPSDLPGLRNVLQKAKDWITWGEIDYELLVEVLKKRGRLVGNKPLTDEIVNKLYAKHGISGGIPDLARALIEGRVRLHKLEHIKPVFRLRPPRGGFRGSVKKPYGDGGELGYRGRAINELISRML